MLSLVSSSQSLFTSSHVPVLQHQLQGGLMRESTSCSLFSQHLAQGAPGVAGSLCGQVCLPWASPEHWLLGVWSHQASAYGPQ